MLKGVNLKGGAVPQRPLLTSLRLVLWSRVTNGKNDFFYIPRKPWIKWRRLLLKIDVKEDWRRYIGKDVHLSFSFLTYWLSGGWGRLMRISFCVCLLTAVYLGSAAEWYVVNNTCFHRRLTVNLPQPERPVTSSEFIAWKICILHLGKIYYWIILPLIL